LAKYSDEKGYMYPWRTEIIPKYVLPFIESKKMRGMKPTVRGVCYVLEKDGVIDKSPTIFRKVVRALATARKNGQIPINAFSDDTRQIIKNFNDASYSLEDYIEDGINRLRRLPDGYQTSAARWLDQPNYVEVWVEKATMAPSVEVALRGLDVVIAANRGWPSMTFVHNNLERLLEEFNANARDRVWVLYLGDLDPSGWAMDKKIKMELAKYLGTRATFKRIGITKEQIRKYHLEHLTNPDPNIIKKYKNPKNRFVKPFVEEFGSAFQIELETLDAQPDFDDIVRKEVEKLYNEQIRKQVQARPQYSQEPSEIRGQIVDALRDLIDELE
jgi:hypothetical protein